MSHLLSLTFQITLVGMGLVFGAILLLWGLMTALTRLLPDNEALLSSSPSREESGIPEVNIAPEVSAEGERRKQAAVAAISVALAQELDHTPHAFPTPPSAAVSPWQAVSRANAMHKRGRLK
jgi:Na+-transporting methylmalonyl-CoA/oxaloacetate decarboxylase gamma subunit